MLKMSSLVNLSLLQKMSSIDLTSPTVAPRPEARPGPTIDICDSPDASFEAPSSPARKELGSTSDSDDDSLLNFKFSQSQQALAQRLAPSHDEDGASTPPPQDKLTKAPSSVTRQPRANSEKAASKPPPPAAVMKASSQKSKAKASAAPKVGKREAAAAAKKKMNEGFILVDTNHAEKGFFTGLGGGTDECGYVKLQRLDLGDIHLVARGQRLVIERK